MKFHESKDFELLIRDIGLRSNVSSAMIEKDYYVTLILKELEKHVPGLIFKGVVNC